MQMLGRRGRYVEGREVGEGGVWGELYLQDRDFEGLFQLVQGGSCQAAAAAPDEAQRWGVVCWPVLAGTSQQHLHPKLAGEQYF